MKKKKNKKIAKSNIKILASGKIKILKGKVNIKPYVKESIKASVVSRLDGIISKEDVVIDTPSETIYTRYMTNPVDASRLFKANSTDTPTIVVTMQKSKVTKSFDFLKSNTIGNLLRISSLASIYSEIRDQWVELNKDDNSEFTNVLFIPDIVVFLDMKSGDLNDTIYKVNLLIVAPPAPEKMVENNLDEVNDTAAASRIIADIVESSIKCGAKNIIVDPYCHKILGKDKSDTALLWERVITGQRFKEQIKSISFAIEDEANFVIFNVVDKL